MRPPRLASGPRSSRTIVSCQCIRGSGGAQVLCRGLAVPNNITLLYLPPYSPELNPKENLWDELREKIFKNYALKSMDAVRAKLRQAILYIERNPKLVRSITSFPYIVNSL